MARLAAQLFGLILLFSLTDLAEAKLIAAPSEFEKTFALQKNVQVADDAESDAEKFAVAETKRITEEIVAASFPELKDAKIEIKTFRSRSDYFRSRFSVSRFLTLRKLHYLIFVNPQVFEKNAPAIAIRAIIAHELAHAAYYRRHNRFGLFGLIALLSDSFTARFERAADLLAIGRGYGAGLEEYRMWLYQNIPAKKVAAKRRDYFSPEEIDLIREAIKSKPSLIDYWLKKVPRSAAEIRLATSGEMLIEK